MLQSWHPTTGSYISTSITILITATATALSIITLVAPTQRWANSFLPKAFYIAAITGFSIPITRALMPWEDPDTGSGSPLAVLIGLCMYSAIGFVLISLPMLWIGKSATSVHKWRS